MAARKRRPAIVSDQETAEDFMAEIRAKDEADSRYGEASKQVKECSGYATEAMRRIQAARTATSTPEAIRHDMERVTQLAGEIERTASEALKHLEL